jgi:hypothetical protein
VLLEHRPALSCECRLLQRHGQLRERDVPAMMLARLVAAGAALWLLGCSAQDPASSPPPSSGGTAGSTGGSGGVLPGTGGIILGTGGGGGGTPPAQLTPLVPTPTNGQYLFTNGDFALWVDPNLAGRVTVLSMGQTNLLTGSDVDATNWGSTFWTAPQSDWNWPPPAEIDSSPFTPTVTGAVLRVAGPASPTLSVAVVKDFSAGMSADASVAVVSITYALLGTGGTVQKSPWEVTRVATGGISFFAAATCTDPTNPIPLPQAAGACWLDYAAAGLAAGQHKWRLDGTGGWLAHTAGGLLFIKRFQDLAPAALPLGHGEIEIYTAPPSQYVELEMLGPYSTVTPGAAVTWAVSWIVTRVPATVPAYAGSPELMALVAQLLGQF